jgi:hypothetical protein
MVRCSEGCRSKLNGQASIVELDNDSSTTLLKDISLGIIDAGFSVQRTLNLRSSASGTKVIDVSVQSTVPGVALSRANGDEVAPRAEEVDKTIVVPVLPPFNVSSNVSYRHSGNSAKHQGVASEAVVASIVTTPGPRAVYVESMELKGNVSQRVHAALYLD